MPPIEITWRYIEWIADFGIKWFQRGTIPGNIGQLVDRARRNNLRFGGNQIRLLNKIEELKPSYHDPDCHRDSRPVIPLRPSRTKTDGAFWILQLDPIPDTIDEGIFCWINVRMMRFCLYNDELRCYGFRFEAPEAPTERNFYPHLQFIKGCSDLCWANEHLPAVPIQAESAPELVLNALISLYGTTDIRTMLGESIGPLKGAPQRYLNQYLEKLRISSSSAN